MQILKIILLITIFGTSTIIGVLISKKYSNRVKTLKDLREALSIFEIKVKFSFETIPEIFDEISKKTRGAVRMIFSDTIKNVEINNMLVDEAWECSVEKNGGDLKIEDIDCIKSLGKLLGKTDVDGQINQINLVSVFIDKQIEEATEEKNKNQKMYQKLGAIVGLIIVIVLF